MWEDAGDGCVCSAHAEVIPTPAAPRRPGGRLLRTRGGDPSASSSQVKYRLSAPHTRR